MAELTARTRVLHVVQNLNYGGMERLVADLVRRVDASRFECQVLALEYLGRFAEGLESTSLHVAAPSRGSMLWPRALIDKMGRIAPDVVHLHSGVWYKGSLAARRAGVTRVIYTEHGRPVLDTRAARVIDRLASRRTDVIVAVSQQVADRLGRGIVADPTRVRIVLNGVDTELHAPRPDTGAIRAELSLDAATPILGSIGRLEHIKGYDVMIEAFARLREQWSMESPPVLLLVGEGSERPALERMTAEKGLGRAVHFLGWRDDIRDLHAAFSLFTMSSRSEGTSVSLLEAMSAGLCPVVTNVGGNAVVLGAALRHRLTPATNPYSLATAWRAAIEDQAGRERDARAARARVIDGFSLEKMVRAYEELYGVG